LDARPGLVRCEQRGVAAIGYHRWFRRRRAWKNQSTASASSSARAESADAYSSEFKASGYITNCIAELVCVPQGLCRPWRAARNPGQAGQVLASNRNSRHCADTDIQQRSAARSRVWDSEFGPGTDRIDPSWIAAAAFLLVRIDGVMVRRQCERGFERGFEHGLRRGQVRWRSARQHTCCLRTGGSTQIAAT
jgi:hypothetical protein